MDITEWALVITSTATAMLAVYAWLQTRHSRNQLQELSLSRNADVILRVFEVMDALRPKWHELYSLPSNHNNWNDSQKQLADHIGTQLQRVAYLAVTGLVDSKYIKESYPRVFYQCWSILENFIKDYREKCGEPRELKKGVFQQRMHFEIFALECRDY